MQMDMKSLNTFLFSLSAVALPCLAGYEVPEPKPVKSAIEVTAIYFPGTPQRSEWEIVRQSTPERKPSLGWFDEGDPVNVDWQIKWAVEHGVSSFCVDWYWNRGVQRHDHWIKAYHKAKYRSYLKWYLLWCNHNEPGSHSVADQTAMVKFWIDNYFCNPEYKKIDGKPVVVIWETANIDRDFIAEAAEKGEALKRDEGLKRCIELSNGLARDAGFPGIYWINQFWEKGEISADIWNRYKACGISEMMNYSYSSHGLTTHPEYASPGDTPRHFSFECVIKAIRHFWVDTNFDPELPFIPYIPTGWDVRPRSFQNARVCYGRTPELFGEVCRSARRFCEEKGFRRVLVGPISEWQEGSYIEPNAEYGFSMYDALRDALCEKPDEGWPANVAPGDLGLPLREYPPLEQVEKPVWDFSKGFGGWFRNPYGAQHLTIVNGALNLVTRGGHAMRACPKPFQAKDHARLAVQMRLTANTRSNAKPKGTETLTMYFGSAEAPLIRVGGIVDWSRQILCPVKVDGEWHEYTVELSEVKGWNGCIDGLALIPVNLRDVFVEIRKIEFLPKSLRELTAHRPPQSISRVREIAAMLPEKPGFPSVSADAREYWGRAPKTALVRADALLAAPRTVNDESNYTNILFHGSKVAREMDALVIAECVENKGRYIPRILEMMDDLCAARTWTNPYHDRTFGNFYGRYRSIDLNAGQISMKLAFAVDLLRERIPRATVDRAMSCFRRFIVEPYLKTARTGDCSHHSWFFGHHNWNPACHWQSVALALSVLPDRIERAEFIEAAERAAPFFLAGFTKEGYCQEGLDYWNYGFGEFLRLAHIVYNATGGKVDFSKIEKAKTCFLFPYEFQLAERCSPQFNDGSASVPASHVLYMGSFFWPDTRTRMTSGIGPFHLAPSVIGVRKDAFAQHSPMREYRLPVRTFFEEAQVFIARPEEPGDSTLSACIKGGSNGVPHNHNDAGQFIIALGTVQMVQDPAGKVYDLDTFGPKRYEHPMLNSYGHAVPFPDGTLQAAGKIYSAKVISTSFADDRDEIVLDLRPVYTNSNILAMTRSLVYSRDIPSVTVSDYAVFAANGTYESPISTYGTVERSGENKFSIVRKTKNGIERLDFTVDTNGAKWHIKEEKIPNPKRTEPTRWAVVIDNPAKEHRVKFCFTSGM